MAKYRVLQIVPALYSGGVGNFLLNYYRRFDKDLFQFDFITHFDERQSVTSDPLMADSQVFYFKQQHDIGTLGYIKQFKKVIKDGNYDIIHIHNGHLTGLLSMICRWYGARNIVCHAHTTRCMDPKLNKAMPMLRWMSRHFADRLMACGHDAGLFCYGTKDFVVIPNGVDFDYYKRSSDNEIIKFKEQYGIAKNKFVIGCVAQFTPPKNHNYLIRVFKEIHDKDQNTVLLLVGDGGLMDDVKEQVRKLNLTDSVIFTGLQRNIPLILSVLDVFLLTSIHEGLPVVAAEAQAMGLKCVFSENIDNSCDRNVGLMTFLPISEDAIGKWVESTFKPIKYPSRELIIQQFSKDYYNIKEGTRLFQNEYLNLFENE